MKIDNIKNYISETNQESFMKLADEIYELTIHLNGTYPGYKEWFYDKQIKGCLTPNRNIIFIKNEEGKKISSVSQLHKKDVVSLHYLDGFADALIKDVHMNLEEKNGN